MICVRRNRSHIFPWKSSRAGPAPKNPASLRCDHNRRLQPNYLHDDTYKLIKLQLNKASTNYTYFYGCIRAASRQFRQLFPRHANSRLRILLLSRNRIAETIKTNLTRFNGGGYQPILRDRFSHRNMLIFTTNPLKSRCHKIKFLSPREIDTGISHLAPQRFMLHFDDFRNDTIKIKNLNAFNSTRGLPKSSMLLGTRLICGRIGWSFVYCSYFIE